MQGSNWIQHWLDGRSQRVVGDDFSSDWRSVISGAPQGPVLLVINDLDDNVENWITKFADDNKIGGSVSSEEGFQSLQEDLDQLEKWQMEFNEDKCEALHFGRTNQERTNTVNGSLFRTFAMLSGNILKVAVRVRPFNQREKAMRRKCIISMVGNNTTVVNPKYLNNKRTFSFDYCYWSMDGYIEDDQGVYLPDEPHSRYINQERIFNDLGRTVLENTWKGYNATLFSYGQTGSGKSYTVTGFGRNKGLAPMICEELFKEIKLHQNENIQFYVYFSMFEIYNEQVHDLLSKIRKPNGLRIREGKNGFYMECLKSVPCGNFEQLEAFLKQGIRNRSVASTNWNTSSSRSHMVIRIHFQQVFVDLHSVKHSEIDLVDLAGSERQRSAGVTSDRFTEARAINLSLTTLGNVISSLSDKAMGKRVQYIPYRNSVLTRLLSSALGGNSKTIMIATISPADACYEETMSTLRFAERAKSIQNRATINESLTEHLFLDLKADNSRLQARIVDLEKAGDIQNDEREMLKQQILENERQVKEMQKSWHQKLEEARREWEQQYSIITKEEKMMAVFPYLLNVNEDPQLSGVIRHFIHNGTSAIGRSVGLEHDIVLKGPGILDKHAVITVCEHKVIIEPVNKGKVRVNGGTLFTKQQLKHLDRIIMGSSLFFLYVGFPHEKSDRDKMHKYNYDFFTSELASIEGFGQVKLGGKQEEILDPNLIGIFHDFIAIMPMVAQVNQICEELKRAITLELQVKNLASTDAKGEELEKEITIKVTNKEANQVAVWTQDKFIDRKLLIENIYQSFLENGIVHNKLEEDPFWDPFEILYLGSAHVWLETLAYCIAFEDQVDVYNHHGKEEAVIQVRLFPSMPKGGPLGDEPVVVNPDNLLGKRLDFQMEISWCLGVKWIRENSNGGVQIGFMMYNLPTMFYTPAVWNNTNSLLDYSMCFTIHHVTPDFLNYLKTHSVVLKLWGLQEGCREMETVFANVPLSSDGNVLLDLSSGNQWTSVPLGDEDHKFKLSQKLRMMEEEVKNLREANQALRNENAKLLKKTKNTSSKHEGDSLKSTDDQSCQRSPLPSMDAEFAKALKTFYFSMIGVRGRLIRLKQVRPLVISEAAFRCLDANNAPADAAVGVQLGRSGGRRETPLCHLNMPAEGEPCPSECQLLWTVALVPLLLSGAMGVLGARDYTYRRRVRTICDTNT
ncbi:kinesin-like protein KIF28 [Narcine bancroftii]|uniref:kinesin-like protein KIF28 n=1 Tax=Narcine bancroftii TaxID=1343680 RepID=UPI003831A539